MISSVEVYNATGVFKKSFVLRRTSSSSSYSISGIEGLGPVAAQISTTDFAVLDGEIFQAAKTGRRNIVLSLTYRPKFSKNETVEQLRRELYFVFTPKSKVRMRFKDSSGGVFDIEGYVETHEPAIFDKNPGAQISILCPMPSFYDPEPTVKEGPNNTRLTLGYKGDTVTGFVADITFNRGVSLVAIDNGVDDSILVASSFVAGDKLTLSTVRGGKYVQRTRNGVNTNLLDSLTNGSLAMQIGPDVQYLAINVSDQISNMTARVSYTNKYSGL